MYTEYMKICTIEYNCKYWLIIILYNNSKKLVVRDSDSVYFSYFT
uniref:Uncharacterized protein n=1 Tax=Heterorhabditis bacteriophora TaxID=37862 RepID=A0A1I7WK75_HETBA